MDPRSQRTALIAILLVAIGIALLLALRNRQRSPQSPGPRLVAPAEQPFDPARFTTGDFHGCSPQGEGGDPALNLLKNRDVPPPAYEPFSVPQLLTNQPQHAITAGRVPRSEWPQAALDETHAWERKGVAVDGYLLKVRHEGPESCNCHSEEDRDYHIWLGASPDDDRASAIVVEISPREVPQHPGWRLRTLQKLARDHARVRISGWLMWDQEHPEQIGKTRGTLWEIHPIHRIEVFNGGGWEDL
jgi:hypothetical protein